MDDSVAASELRRPGDGSRFYIMLSIGLLLCVLLAVAVVKASLLLLKVAKGRVS